MVKVKYKYFIPNCLYAKRGLGDSNYYNCRDSTRTRVSSVRLALRGGRRSIIIRLRRYRVWDRNLRLPPGSGVDRHQHRYHRKLRIMSLRCPRSQSSNLVYRLWGSLVHGYINSPHGRHNIINKCISIFNVMLSCINCQDIPIGIRKITATELIVVPGWIGLSTANQCMYSLSAEKVLSLKLPKGARGKSRGMLHWCRDRLAYLWVSYLPFSLRSVS